MDLSRPTTDMFYPKLMEEFQYKCLESFDKTKNKVIQKSPFPKVSILGGKEQDTKAHRRMI